MRFHCSNAYSTIKASISELTVLCIAVFLITSALAQDSRSSFAPSRPVVSVNDLSAPKPALKEYRKAIDASRKRNYEDALRHVQLALDRHPQFPAALTWRAVLELDAGQFTQAESDLQRALSLSPNDAFIYAVLGAVYDDTMRFDEARYCLERALSFSPDSSFALLELARLDYETGHFDDSWKSLERAAEFIPSDNRDVQTVLHLIRGYVLVALNMRAEARTNFEQVLHNARPGTPFEAVARDQIEKLRRLATSK